MASPFSATAPPPPSREVSERHARRRRRERDQHLVVVVVAASAALAALAPAAPTGLGVADALWCATLGGAVSWAASRSRRWAWLWCAGLVAAFGIGSWWGVLGMVALGLALVGAFLDSRARVLGAVLGLLLAQALLRMPAQGFFGLPSVVAAAAVLPLFGSAYERSTLKVRRRIGRAVLVVGGLVVLATGALGLAAAMGRHELDDAVTNSKAGLELIRTGEQSEATGRLDTAADEFGKADDVLGAFWTWPARLVPVVAQHRDALVEASASGAHIARAGAVASSTADYQQLKASDGRIDLATVRSMQGPVSDTADSLLAAQRTLRSVRSSWLLAPVADPLASFDLQVDQALPEAELAREALLAAPGLLGAGRDRTYLILFTNPAESRFLGGFTGSYGIMVAHQGKVSFTVGNRISQLFPGPAGQSLTIPGDIQYKTRYDQYGPAQNFQNLTVSPDMPTDAGVTRALFQEYYHKSLDGVLVVDPYGLAALLKLTGPVAVAGLDVPLTSANAADYLIRRQYLIYGDEHTDRKDVLSAAGKATFKALTSRHLPGPRDVGAALGPVVAEKRLLFYPFDPSFQPLFSRVGTLGAFRLDQGSDYLSLRSANANASKIDSFLTRSVTYDASYDPANGNVEATVTIALHNSSPAGGLPEYMIGNEHDPTNSGTVPVGSNTMYVSYYSPLVVQSTTINGKTAGVEEQTELGSEVYSELVRVLAGQTATIVFHLEGSVDAGSTYRLQVLSQPMVHDDQLTVRVRSSSPTWHVVSAPGLAVGPGGASASQLLDADHTYSIRFAS